MCFSCFARDLMFIFGKEQNVKAVLDETASQNEKDD
jgi:hypothetical protein